MTEDARLFPRVEEWVAQLEAMGHHGLAGQARKLLEMAEADYREFWNAPLTYAQAHEWGGYDETSLRRHVREGKTPLTPNGCMRRRHVPTKPGHVLPLGLDPNESAEQSWADRVRAEREAS